MFSGTLLFFEVDIMGILTYKGKNFYLDGEKYTVISGAMHYFRIPREYWHDRLLKLKECGFNTVETYTCWNLHEPKENVFDFTANLDIAEYIRTAKELGLNVIVRPGPYICAEWEFGGLPAWLLTYENIPLRCYNEEFIALVRRYYEALFNEIRPYLAVNGGNIVMLQVENEYGSYGDDTDYMRAVAKIYKDNNMECLYFTSDGPTYSMLSGGTLPEYLCVANFGSKPKEQMKVLAELRPDQPLMCGEYWCGWFDHWGEKHHAHGRTDICDDVNDFFDLNASFNFYMFHGGTNFGFMNGANHGTVVKGEYEPTVTSYDYAAPLTEAGDRTALYYALRDTISKRTGVTPPLTAKESEKAAYGKVELIESAYLFDNLDNLSCPIPSAAPKFMENVGQSYGYILYRSTVKGPRNDRELYLEPVHDRAHIFVNGELKSVYYRNVPVTPENAVKLPLGYGESATLDILVENMGRINYGPKLRDQKGLKGVRLGNQYHFGWEIYPLPMNNLSALVYEKATALKKNAPVFLRGSLKISDTPKDTFIRLDGFKKGFVTVNGINIGRYFNEAGPQKTLYVPAPFLKQGENEITVFETDGVTDPTVTFTDTPEL